MMTAKELTNEITNYVNTFSLNDDEFNEAMSQEHRTLQQSFTRLCLKWIEHCAGDEYRHDPRNEGSHKVSKMIVESFMESNDVANVFPSKFLPYI